MARYIGADKAKHEFNIGFGGISHAVIANQIIDSVPTADVEEVRHGEWVDEIRTFSVMDKYGYVREEQKKTHTCSLCRVGIVGLDNMRYCPNCGAKMDGGKAE